MQWLPCSATRHNDSVTTARFGHSTVCIPGAGSVWGTDLVVVFGGVSYTDTDSTADQHAALADVAVLQAEADMWFTPQVSAAEGNGSSEGGGGLPEARAYHCAAAVDRRMYVFGGHVLSYDPEQNKKRRRFFNDLWCLDTDTWTWQRLDVPHGASPAPEQPPRRDMATLSRAGPSCLLLFGGRLESGRVAGDAWVLDLNTHTWSLLKIPGPTPPARKMHAAVYATNRVVLFGGERDAGVLDDLWTLKGADGSEAAKWTQIRLRPAPSGRFGHAMAAYGSRLAVFGGCLDQSSLLSFSRTYVQCNELWVLDMATFSWHRLEAPEGAAPVTGVAFNDPNLIVQLQQQADQQAEQQQQQQQLVGSGGGHQQPGGGQQQAPLVLLPAERMCHCLVPVGAGRLLLVGGRKRDGICTETWWLSMGPDNLTPTLTVPPADIVVAAVMSAGASTAVSRRVSGATTETAAAAATAAPPRTPVAPQAQTLSPPPGAQPPATHTSPSPAPQPPPPPPPPLPPTSSGSTSLLQNLLRKSASPQTAAAAPLIDLIEHDAGVGPAAAAPSSTTAASAASGASGVSGKTLSLGLPASTGGAPTAAAFQAHSPGGGMAPSRSTGSLRDTGSTQQTSTPSTPTTTPAGVVGQGHYTFAPLMGSNVASTATSAATHTGSTSAWSQQQQQQQQAPAGAAGPSEPRMADRASTALSRITNKFSTLLNPGALAAGNMRLQDGRQVAATSPAAVAVQQQQQPPPLPGIGSGFMPGRAAAGPVSPLAAETCAFSASSSLPLDAAASWELLRNRLGLSTTTATSRLGDHTAGSSGGGAAGDGSASQSSLGASEPLDPIPALAALGRRLTSPGAAAAGSAAVVAEVSGGSGGAPAVLVSPRGGGGREVEAAVGRARRHLACCAAEQLAVGQLPVLLADCQALLKARGAVSWAALERESWQRTHGSTSTPPAAPPPDLAVLATYVSSCSHPLAGLRAEDLRVADVPELLASYRSLVLSGEVEMGAAGGMQS